MGAEHRLLRVAPLIKLDDLTGVPHWTTTKSGGTKTSMRGSCKTYGWWHSEGLWKTNCSLIFTEQARCCFDILSSRVLISKNHDFTSLSVQVSSTQHIYASTLFFEHVGSAIWICMLFLCSICLFGCVRSPPFGPTVWLVPRCGLFPSWSHMWFVFRTAKNAILTRRFGRNICQGSTGLMAFYMQQVSHGSLRCCHGNQVFFLLVIIIDSLWTCQYRVVIECSQVVTFPLPVRECIHFLDINFIHERCFTTYGYTYICVYLYLCIYI